MECLRPRSQPRDFHRFDSRSAQTRGAPIIRAFPGESIAEFKEQFPGKKPRVSVSSTYFAIRRERAEPPKIPHILLHGGSRGPFSQPLQECFSTTRIRGTSGPPGNPDILTWHCAARPRESVVAAAQPRELSSAHCCVPTGLPPIMFSYCARGCLRLAPSRHHTPSLLLPRARGSSYGSRGGGLKSSPRSRRAFWPHLRHFCSWRIR